jgi:sterol desaturase/sphingolipid hydroxylase (fatty acid hydroxylase superfamily)
MVRPLHSGARSARTVRHDRAYTLVTVALGTILGAATAILVVDGLIPLRTGWPTPRRFALEVGGYVLLFDAYFYALHRLFHTRLLFRTVHATHHRSHAPVLATALAMHPVESLAIMGFMPVTMYLLPIHLASLAVIATFLLGSILLAHCNWDVTGRTHHAHHTRHDCNYGATLSVFDRLFGTWNGAWSLPAPQRLGRLTAPSRP